jgi:hypothetical protein
MSCTFIDGLGEQANLRGRLKSDQGRYVFRAACHRSPPPSIDKKFDASYP